MWLIGMMGAGKTSIGAGLAERLVVPFYDTDLMVIEMSGISIEEIWESQGESGFRRLERQAVSAVPVAGCVAAAGGGAVVDAGNRSTMKKAGSVVWLRCDPATLAERVDIDNRPLLAIDDRKRVLTRLVGEREPLYESLATHVIDTDATTIEESIGELIELWNA